MDMPIKGREGTEDGVDLQLVPSHGTENILESGEATMHESTPFLQEDEESEIEETASKSLGTGFFWIQAGTPSIHFPRYIRSGEETSHYQISGNR